MDSNGTRFQLLLGMDDWGACSVDGQSVTLSHAWTGRTTPDLLRRAGWDPLNSELTLPAEVFEFPPARNHVAPLLESRRGADSDAYGNWYWIDDTETSVVVMSSGSSNVTTFWSTGDAVQGAQWPASPVGGFGPAPSPNAPPEILRGLAVTLDHHLVVGVVEPAGLLIFDLHAGGAPLQQAWPSDFQPWDIGSGRCGTWILERPSAPRTARVWLLGPHLGVVDLNRVSPDVVLQSSFRSVDGTPALVGDQTCGPPPVVTDALALNLPSVHDAVAVETLPDGSALVLDNSDPVMSAMWRIAPSADIQGPLSLHDVTDLIAADERWKFSLRAQDCVVIPNATPSDRSSIGTLLVVAQNGEQVYAFSIAVAGYSGLQFSALPQYWPMRLYGGRGLFASGMRVLYDSRGTWVPLVQQPRLRYETERTILTPIEPDPSNRTVRHALDGRDPDCVWHRLMLDGCIPHECEVHIWSRAANTESELANTTWQPEPDPYQRSVGSELPFLRDAGQNGRGTWELLFQRARGRYLQLKIALVGNARGTPRLRALRAYYPRFSYLQHYLPAAYQSDLQSASFLDRFLSNLEGIYTGLEDRLDAVAALFDPRSAPADALTWLATWLGIVLDANWEPGRQRLLIELAPELFRLRGTRLGLIRAVRLATDPCPMASTFEVPLDDESSPQPGRIPSAVRVVEQFRTRLAPGVVFGDPSQIQGPGISTPVSTWTPDKGPAPLHALFRAFLLRQYAGMAALNNAWGTTFGSIDQVLLWPTRPDKLVAAADWSHFLAAGLGFTYADIDARDEPAYRTFLMHRYGRIDRLNQAYGLAGTFAFNTFTDVHLPTELPTQLNKLRDWFQFVSTFIPTSRNAHRFTVLVPTATGEQDLDRGNLVDRVRQLIGLEKPVHTVFDVKEYWALFRVGEARLGFDTLVDRGSRLVPIVLDSSYLVQGYLTPQHPYNLSRRMVVGRDRVEDARPL